jgi:hypothetical protein
MLPACMHMTCISWTLLTPVCPGRQQCSIRISVLQHPFGAAISGLPGSSKHVCQHHQPSRCISYHALLHGKIIIYLLMFANHECTGRASAERRTEGRSCPVQRAKRLHHPLQAAAAAASLHPFTIQNTAYRWSCANFPQLHNAAATTLLPSPHYVINTSANYFNWELFS